MQALLPDLVVIAAEGVPYDSPMARLAVPLGILIFLGGPYLLLRSNLGTRRGYLVMATSTFGFTIILSLFWAFGAPGTPANTGPTNLPGQVPNEYQPVWTPFAEDSLIAEREPYVSVISDEGAFGEEPPQGLGSEQIDAGVGDIQNFFSSESGGGRMGEQWGMAESPQFAVAPNGQPVMRATFGEVYQLDDEGNLPEGISEEQLDEVIPEGEQGAESFTAYAFFDAGNPIFPSLVFLGVSTVLFAFHAVLLYRDEQREKREAGAELVEEPGRVPAGV
ncbi:MAG: hypothetical protein GEU81_00850 [Nitriliruptorales bacterium]|nr:hypothetical protein [Nitriliruptorales bacterium]